MDSFGKTPNNSIPVIKDTLITNYHANKNNTGNIRRYIPPAKDTISLSNNEIDRIVQNIKTNKVTDITSITNFVTSKEVSNFDINKLTDHQSSKIISAVRHNIAEHMAEIIYEAKTNEKIVDITSKEKALIDNILLKLRQSQITNINQAVDFVQAHSSENPTLLSKISGQLMTVVNSKIQGGQTSSGLINDQFGHKEIPAAPQGNFSNPFSSDIITRKYQPKTPEEAKQFLDTITKDRKAMAEFGLNPRTIDAMSNAIVAKYIQNNDINALLNNKSTDKINKMMAQDQMWLHNNILSTNVSYLNDIAAKVASRKAKTIITCRLMGEVGGAATAALGMASMVGTSPLIGIVGALLLTMVATVVGFVIGKALGEEMGKIITKTNLIFNSDDNNNAIELMEHQGHQQSSDEGSDEDEEDEDYDDNEGDEETSPGYITFNEMDTRVSNALKSRIIYKKN